MKLFIVTCFESKKQNSGSAELSTCITLGIYSTHNTIMIFTNDNRV